MFQVRGYLLDIGRDRVPTLRTLREIVDLLARCRYNQLQLAVGHAFAYARHPAVWEEADPLTPAEIRKLDAYCQMQGVDLVASPSAFGHLERWLELPEYNALAKFPKGGVLAPDGTLSKRPTTLDPANPRALAFVDGLFEELLPNFSAPYANVDGGASFEVDDPEAQLGFLAQVMAAAKARGKRPIFWGDLVVRRPELAARLPKDAIAVVRGYEADHPFEAECEALRKTGLDFYVSPGTSAWRSLAGRVENMRTNLEQAERAGRHAGAKGYLVADWGGEGHWQPLAASLPGLVMGGAFASSGASAAKMDLERELDRVMDAPLGGLLLRLGTLYLRGGALRRGCSELDNILRNGHGYSRHPGLTDAVLEEIGGVAAGVRLAAEKWCDRNDWAKEIAYMADLVDCACHRRDEGRLRALREEHGRIWRLRSKEGGRIDSLAKLPRF